MFESLQSGTSGTAGTAAVALSSAELAGLVAALGRFEPDLEDAARVDQIRLLEQLKSAAAAAQAAVTAAFAASQRAVQAAAGTPGERLGRGVAAQVGLARRISPHHATRYTGWATILVSELPHTYRALRAGRVSEWPAMIVARETAWLSVEHRAQVDADLAPRLEKLGDRRVQAEAKKAAYRLDPHGYLARVRGAHGDRRVGLSPAPDTMARLTGLLPVAQGVAAYAALNRHADTLIRQGDARTRGQIMADTMVERLTGQANASDVPIEIGLLILGAPRVHRPRHRPAGRDGLDPPRLHRKPAPHAGVARLELPHPVVRGTDPPRRPRPARPPGRDDSNNQRARPVRGLQPRQTSTRLADHARPHHPKLWVLGLSRA